MKYDFDKIINRKNTGSIKWKSEIAKPIGITDHFNDDTISVWLADMEFECSDAVRRAIKKAAEQPLFGYETHHGNFRYFEAVKNWFYNKYMWKFDNDDIVFTPNILTGLKSAILAFSNEGDGVIIQPPVYGQFQNIINTNNRNVVSNHLINKNGIYKIDFKNLEDLAGDDKNKILLLCHPHNPTGVIFSDSDLKKINNICTKNNVIIISDEVHGGIVREGSNFVPMAKTVNNNSIITCTGIGKPFNLSGLHIANMIIPDRELRKQFNRVHEIHLSSSIGVEAAIAAYNESDQWLFEVNKYIDENLKFIKKYLAEKLPKVVFHIPQSTYFAWLDFSSYNLPKDKINNLLYKEANVCMEKGGMFGPESDFYHRMTTAIPRSVLKEILDRFYKVLSPYENR